MPIQIMLDLGANFRTTVTDITGNVLTIATPLPGTVGGNYGDPIENMVLSLGNGVASQVFILNQQGSDTLDFNVLG